MVTKLLGVDVSNKSTEELHHIVETLGLQNLSKESLKKLEDFPDDMKKNWLDNPDSTGEFTDDSVSNLSDSFSEVKDEPDVIDEKKIYSNKYADVIHNLSQKAYDLACGSYETALDRQAAHYDNFYDAVKASDLKLNDKEIDFLSEKVASNMYDYERDKFTCGEVKKHGGKFTVWQSGKSDINFGKELNSHVDDIECALGDEIGMPDSTDKNIFITPTNNASFNVYFTNAYAGNDANVKTAIREEIVELGFNEKDFIFGETEPSSENEMNFIKTHDVKTEPVYSVPENSTVAKELAQQVMDTGYNKDGYDDTGHSDDGFYDPRYDTAYTDQGPEM